MCDGLEEDGGGGDSPLIVDVEMVASIPANVLDPSSGSVNRAPAATVASSESMSEGAPTPES